MKPKHQRLVLALVAFVALIGAGFIAAAALKEEASYFLEVTIIESKRLLICVLTPDNIFSKAASISYNF